MATTNITGGQTSDTRLQAQQAAKVSSKAAVVVSPQPAQKAQATPAVVVSLNRPQTAVLPTYNAAAQKTVAKPATPQPAAAAKPATPQPTAAATPTASADDGALYATGDRSVTVDIKASDSGYENKIYWSSDNWATRNYLGVDNHTASFDLGSFAKGTKIAFAIDNGQGDFFKSGGGNADGFQHTRVSADSSGVTVGFEDLRGGGDQDFNDAIVRISGLTSTPVAAPAKSPQVGAVTPPKAANPPAPVVSKPTPSVVQKPDTKDNRSGLGDGTNPGNGSGSVKSPNVGTDNPNQARTAAQLAQAAANAQLALLKTQTSTAQQGAAQSSASVARKA